jgi:hypothetical protein
MLLPILGDRILATEGYQGQMTAEPAIAGTSDNLFEPLSGDAGAHGRFDDRARRDVIGFKPVWLRIGMACGLLGVMAGIGVLSRARGTFK